MNAINIKDKSGNTLMKAASFRSEIRKTAPHKHHNYFEIIYLSQGSGTHTIDHNTFQIQPPVLFFVRKEQVHHWDIINKPIGFIIIIKKEFVEQSIDGELRTLFSKISSISHLRLADTKTIDHLFALLTTESNFTVVEGLLKALFAKILETALPHQTTEKPENNVFLAYKNLLGNTAELQNNVSHYAEKLNTSRQNLNAICRKNSNTSAADILAEYIINEAKRLLIYTDNSASRSSDFKCTF